MSNVLKKKEKKLKILIATGIYPPDLGGPAEYAYNLEKVWINEGNKVYVKYFGTLERALPMGLRHLYFLIKSILAFLRADHVFVLDTFSVALPIAVLSKIFKKSFVIRVGGDFLWESYVERTEKKVLLKDFYNTEIQNLSKKEEIIFNLTKWILKQAKEIIFTTNWQRRIWQKPYRILYEKTRIVENYIGERLESKPPIDKIFVGSTRDLIWKNVDILKKVFDDKDVKKSGAILDLEKMNHYRFLEKIQNSYALILVSLGDISPNMILDAVRCGKPFICTRECGLHDMLQNIGIWVNPLDEREIAEKIIWLGEKQNYIDQSTKIASFKIINNWQNLAKELIKNHEKTFND